MSTETLLKSWLFQYACKKKYHVILKEFYARLDASEESQTVRDSIPNIQLALCILHNIVVADFNISQFDSAVSLFTDIYETLSISSLSYKSIKVMTGLKIMFLFHMLKTNNKLVLPRLNEYFPRTGLVNPKCDKKIGEKLNVAQLKFRKFFLSLISDRIRREAYMKGRFLQEYGTQFQATIKQLMVFCISQVEQDLPLTPIEMISAGGGASARLCGLLNELRCPYVHSLLDSLAQVDSLSVQDVRELLTALSHHEKGLEVASFDPWRQLLEISSASDSRENNTPSQSSHKQARVSPRKRPLHTASPAGHDMASSPKKHHIGESTEVEVLSSDSASLSTQRKTEVEVLSSDSASLSTQRKTEVEVLSSDSASLSTQRKTEVEVLSSDSASLSTQRKTEVEVLSSDSASLSTQRKTKEPVARVVASHGASPRSSPRRRRNSQPNSSWEAVPPSQNSPTKGGANQASSTLPQPVTGRKVKHRSSSRHSSVEEVSAVVSSGSSQRSTPRSSQRSGVVKRASSVKDFASPVRQSPRRLAQGIMVDSSSESDSQRSNQSYASQYASTTRAHASPGRSSKQIMNSGSSGNVNRTLNVHATSNVRSTIASHMGVLPDLSVHLQPSSSKLCVVKLRRDKDLEKATARKHKIFT